MPIRTIAAGSAVFAAIVGGLWILWQVVDVLLVVFAGVLLAVIWRNAGERLASLSRLPARLGTAVVIALTFVATAGFIWSIGPLVANQADQLAENVVQTLSRLEEEASRYAWGRWVYRDALPSLGEGGDGAQLLGRITGAFSTALGILGNLVVILMVGIYTALTPAEYRAGAVSLLPPRHRKRGREVLSALDRGLWHWLLGQLVAMFGVGIATTLGLWLLGIPLAIVLGIIAGVLNFIPLAGPFLAAVPAVLVAFAQSPTDALYVALLFLGVQQLEGNVLTPLAQQQAVNLPPATLLASLAAFGVLLGPLGVLLATPLAVVVTVLVKMIYIEGVLEEPAEDLP